MKVLSFLFLGLVLCYSANAQPYNFDALKTECKQVYTDETMVIYNAKSQYSFYTSSNSDNPVVGKLESENLIVKIVDRGSVELQEGTSSFSTVRNVIASKYDESRDRFKSVSAQMEKHHYESNGIFHNDFYINLIGASESDAGIYQLGYTKLYSDYKFLASVPFSGGTPSLNEEIVLEIPKWLEVDILEQNFSDYGIAKTQTTTSDGATRYTYTWKNIPKFDDVRYSPSSRFYLPHLILIYKSIDYKGTRTMLMPDADGLYAWYRSLVKEVDNQPEALEGLVSQFKDLPKGDAQIDSVYAWVRDNIRYIAFESGMAGFKPENCQNVYNNRYGDCKGMANLCKNILVSLGYDARLAWIGTRSEVPYGYEIPSLIVDNHMITALKEDTSFVFLDPTETYGRAAEYAYRIQGRPVLIEDGDSFILTVVPESEKESDRVSQSYTVHFNPEKVMSSYNAISTYRGEPKKQILSGLNNIFAKDRDEALTNYLRINATGSFELKETTGLDKTDDQVEISYAFTTSEGIIDLGGEYYIDIDPSYDLENAEVTENRRAPWFFSQRYNRETQIEFDVPEGYDVTYMPKSFQYVNEDFKVSVAVKDDNNTVRVDKKIRVFSGMINPENQSDWEACLSELKEYYEDRVIIKKK